MRKANLNRPVRRRISEQSRFYEPCEVQHQRLVLANEMIELLLDLHSAPFFALLK